MTTTTTNETLNKSPSQTIFFSILPTAAIAFAVAALISPPPRSVPIIVILVLTALILSLSAFVTYRGRRRIIVVVNDNDDDDGNHASRARDEVRRIYSNTDHHDHENENAHENEDANDNDLEQNENDNERTCNYPTPVMSSVALYNTLQTVMRPSTFIFTLLYASSFTFILFLLIRLFSVNNFGGVPQNLDFGPKVSKDSGGDGNGKKPVSETNIALEELDFDTLAHVLQGFLAAALSFPAVVGFGSNLMTKVIQFVRLRLGVCIGKIRGRRASSSPSSSSPVSSSVSSSPQLASGVVYGNENMDDTHATSTNNGNGNGGCCSCTCTCTSLVLEKPCFVTMSILQLLCTVCTYYPFYSMVKRMRYSSFAQTSHLNNTMEWCSGFILGISIGSLASSLIKYQFITAASNEEGRKRVIKILTVREGTAIYSYGRASDFKGEMKYSYLFPMVEYVLLGNLILFAVTTLLTGVNIALSWNYKNDNTASGVMIAVYIPLYAVIYAMFFGLSIWG